MIIKLADGTTLNVTGAHEITREQIVAKLDDLNRQQADLGQQIANVQADLAEFDRVNPEAAA